MYVKVHRLFEILLQTTAKNPEAAVGFSLSASPKLGDFLAELAPDLSLDWSGQSFQGMPALREHVLRVGGMSNCRLEDILVTAGAAEANFLAIMQLVQPGDEMVVESPGWPQPLVLGEAIGATVRPLRRREEQGWAFDLAELEALVTPKTRLIFLTNPNNPTGHLLSAEELGRVAEIAARVGAYLLVDEVYAGLEWAAGRSPSVADLYERGITTGSVSKALGLQGLRTGWLVCRDPKLVSDAVVLRENSSEIMNVLGEAVAEIALRPERYRAALDRAREEGRANLALLERFVSSRPELSWVAPRAGLIGLARLSGIDSDALSEAMLEPPFKTLVIPGSAYGLSQHIRLGVGGGAAANLEEGLRRLGRFLDGVQGQTQGAPASP
ncbi:MAG: aminotransferase class I/II-fold pyridoxal phosphate-dependent enzyme [Meiothermus sp.]|nr:aminotransferase class I/II-fold pyridoxal phosphate-dependent enzyme [Meiothermus sp.]